MGGPRIQTDEERRLRRQETQRRSYEKNRHKYIEKRNLYLKKRNLEKKQTLDPPQLLSVCHPDKTPNVSATSGCSTFFDLTSNQLASDQTPSPKVTASARIPKATAPVQPLTVESGFSRVWNRFTAINAQHSAFTLRPADTFSDGLTTSGFQFNDGCDSDNGSTHTSPSDASFSSWAEEFTEDNEFLNNDCIRNRITQLWNYPAYVDEDKFIDAFHEYRRSALAYMRMGPNELRDVLLRLSTELKEAQVAVRTLQKVFINIVELEELVDFSSFDLIDFSKLIPKFHTYNYRLFSLAKLHGVLLRHVRMAITAQKTEAHMKMYIEWWHRVAGVILRNPGCSKDGFSSIERLASTRDLMGSHCEQGHGSDEDISAQKIDVGQEGAGGEVDFCQKRGEDKN